LAVALSSGRPGGLLRLLSSFLLGLILGLLFLRLLLLLGLLVVLLVTVVRVAMRRRPKEVRADRGDGKGGDEPVAVR